MIGSIQGMGMSPMNPHSIAPHAHAGRFHSQKGIILYPYLVHGGPREGFREIPMGKSMIES